MFNIFGFKKMGKIERQTPVKPLSNGIAWTNKYFCHKEFSATERLKCSVKRKFPSYEGVCCKEVLLYLLTEKNA